MISDMREDSKILLKASLVGFFAIGLLTPIYAIFVQKIGGDVLDAGIAYAIFSISTGLFIITFGTSKFFSQNIRSLIVTGYILFAIGNLGYLFVQNPIHLFIVQLIFGIAYGILEPSWDSVFAAKLDEKQASKHWSLWSGSSNLILGIAALTGGFIVSIFSFKLLFVIMFIFSLISALISFKILRKFNTK